LQGWSAPNYQSFDWGVASFAVGIALYFALPFEPSLIALAGICALIGLLTLVADRFVFRLYPLVFIVFLIALGVGRATWHTQAAATP